MPFGTKSVMSSYMDKDIDEIIRGGSAEKAFLSLRRKTKRSGSRTSYQEHPIYFTFVVIDDMVPLLSLSGRAWDVYCRCRWDKRYGQVVERRL